MEPVSDDLRYLVQDAPNLRVLRGLEQLDLNLNAVADLSDSLLGGTVQRQNYADEHLTADLRLSIALPWETVRLRPYVTLTDGIRSERCDLGVVIPKRPKDNLALSPQTYDVQCVDLLARLRREIEAPMTFQVGDAPLFEAAAICYGQGFTGPAAPLFDGSGQDKTLAYPINITITEDDPVPTYLTVINRLLSSIGYRGLYADPRGRFRSEPYQSPSVRAPDWIFDAQADNRITDARVEREVEAVDAPNVWIFKQRGNPTPTEGNGQHTILNQSDGPSSIDSVSRNASTRFFDAADQTALVAQATRAVESDRRRSTLLRFQTSPMPILGHFDVMSYTDARLGLSAKVLARSWRVDLGIGNSEHVVEVVS